MTNEIIQRIIPDAIIAANGINILCDNLYTDNEDLQGLAAIAVSILSNVNEGRRKLLYKLIDWLNKINIKIIFNNF